MRRARFLALLVAVACCADPPAAPAPPAEVIPDPAIALAVTCPQASTWWIRIGAAEPGTGVYLFLRSDTLWLASTPGVRRVDFQEVSAEFPQRGSVLTDSTGAAAIAVTCEVLTRPAAPLPAGAARRTE